MLGIACNNNNNKKIRLIQAGKKEGKLRDVGIGNSESEIDTKHA